MKPGPEQKDSDDISALGNLAVAWAAGGPRYLSTRFSIVSKLIDRSSTRALVAGFGISLAEWRMLGDLAAAGPLTIKELAERCWVDKAEVSRAASSLASKRYVRREENEEDRRSPSFSLTPSGRTLVQRIKPGRNEFQDLLRSTLSAEEEETLYRCLFKVARVLLSQSDEPVD